MATASTEAAVKIDAYLEKLPDWSKALCKKLRANRQFSIHIRAVTRMDAYFNNKLKLT